MNCPRCNAYLAGDITHVTDTATGMVATSSNPVADHLLECFCGWDCIVVSSCSTVHHPGQLTLIRGAA